MSQLSKKYKMEAGPGSVGESRKLFKKQAHPYETRRYTLISRDKKVTVSDVKNDIISLFYGKKVLPQTGMETRLGQHVFFIDVATWSDMAPKSKIHSAFFIHGVPLKKKRINTSGMRIEKRILMPLTAYSINKGYFYARDVKSLLCPCTQYRCA